MVKKDDEYVLRKKWHKMDGEKKIREEKEGNG